MQKNDNWLLAGLFGVTLSTLCLEILDTRLLSVVTWYHLSFFAVSIAMFGMAAGALRVQLSGDRWKGDAARELLARETLMFAIAIPLCYLGTLAIPIPEGFSLRAVIALGLSTALLALPFYLSGVVVTLCLTRCGGKIGLLYFADLVGAACGALIIQPLLEHGNAASTAIACGSIAAIASACFRLDRGRLPVLPVVTAGLLAAFAFANHGSPPPIGVWYSKGKFVDPGDVEREEWNIHAQVIVRKPKPGPPIYWGPGSVATPFPNVNRMRMLIDGDAGTYMTQWDGDPTSLEWIRRDVTSLPHHLRRKGVAAVIGVGGGRDMLTGLWAEHRSVTGIEINDNFIELLEGPFREYANIATRSDVKLVHDEARSYLTRDDTRYDVLQMSLIDTWAATGAGAFTLSENGLYTVEAWRVFMNSLTPTGLFSVSRWYDPELVSETSRLLALATHALLERGVANPREHMALVAAGKVATLVVSPTPLSDVDRAGIREACKAQGFRYLLGPDQEPEGDHALGPIASARSFDELDRAVYDEWYDFRPPTDAQPYFFNLLRPAAAWTAMTGGVIERQNDAEIGGVLEGNMVATSSLMALVLVALIGALGIIALPLFAGRPKGLSTRELATGIAYFAAIGVGFLFVQVPFMQRFSVYLGHPSHAVVVILFSMILAAGIGSLCSERFAIEKNQRFPLIQPLSIAVLLVLWTLGIQPLIESTIQLGLFTRSVIVIIAVTPPSFLMGMCFPMGMRLVAQISADALPWMWATNGAASVLGGVLAMGVSIWTGIDTGLLIGAACYACLAIFASSLWRMGASRRTGNAGLE